MGFIRERLEFGLIMWFILKCWIWEIEQIKSLIFYLYILYLFKILLILPKMMSSHFVSCLAMSRAAILSCLMRVIEQGFKFDWFIRWGSLISVFWKPPEGVTLERCYSLRLLPLPRHVVWIPVRRTGIQLVNVIDPVMA